MSTITWMMMFVFVSIIFLLMVVPQKNCSILLEVEKMNDHPDVDGYYFDDDVTSLR